MPYKHFFLGILGTWGVWMAGILYFACLMDPIGIWNSPMICGVNHYKVKQEGYLDVYKPYEYIREKPDILYIGGSQIYIGFEPFCNEHMEKKVYIMGLSSLTLPDLREYLRFVYKTHRPEVIYMGISPRNFSVKDYYRKRPGFSKERLERLTENWLEYYKQAIQDSLSLHDVYWTTLTASRLHKGDDPLFLNGWDTKRGRAEAPNSQMYYNYLGKMLNEDLKYEEEFVSDNAVVKECLRDIANEAQEAGVSLIAFFPPLSVDHLAVFELLEKREGIKKQKREIAKILPVYDFEVLSEWTINRQAYFYDTVHFRAVLGDKLKSCLNSGNPTPYGYWLTSETADEVFVKEDTAWEKWRADHQEYINVLKECIEMGHKPKVGEFEKYIGF